MSGKTLLREPWRGGQLCGAKIDDSPWMNKPLYCGENKMPGQTLCARHWDQPENLYAHIDPSYALGIHIHWSVRDCWAAYDGSDVLLGSSDDRLALEQEVGLHRLQWEGPDGEPIDATPSEVSAWLASAM